MGDARRRLPRQTTFRNQFPAGLVCFPAWDIGAPYFARFSGVSGTGPLVTVVWVTVAFEFVAAVSALEAIGIEGDVSGCMDEFIGGLAGAMAPDASCAQTEPARDAASKPTAAAIFMGVTAKSFCSIG